MTGQEDVDVLVLPELAGQLSLDRLRERFMECLVRATGFALIPELKYSAVHPFRIDALHEVFRVASARGSMLHGAWRHVFHCISTLEYALSVTDVTAEAPTTIVIPEDDSTPTRQPVPCSSRRRPGPELRYPWGKQAGGRLQQQRRLARLLPQPALLA